MIQPFEHLAHRFGIRPALVSEQEHLQLELLATHAVATQEDEQKRQAIREELETLDAQGGPRLQREWFDYWRERNAPVRHPDGWAPWRCA